MKSLFSVMLALFSLFQPMRPMWKAEAGSGLMSTKMLRK